MDEILDLIESVSQGFPTCTYCFTCVARSFYPVFVRYSHGIHRSLTIYHPVFVRLSCGLCTFYRSRRLDQQQRKQITVDNVVSLFNCTTTTPHT